MGESTLEPRVLTYELSCSPAEAFEVFTERISDWWHPDYTPDPHTLESVTIEPRVGGRVFSTHSDIGEEQWGEVTEWRPGERLSHTFRLAHGGSPPSQVTVEFAARDAGVSRMTFSHGGWNPENVGLRGKFGDWSVMLDRMAALAQDSY